MNYTLWLNKNDIERKEYLQELKDNIRFKYEEDEEETQWNLVLDALNRECIHRRLQEYPTINDLIIAQYEGDAREMHDKRDAVRNKYPKVIDTTD